MMRFFFFVVVCAAHISVAERRLYTVAHDGQALVWHRDRVTIYRFKLLLLLLLVNLLVVFLCGREHLRF
jgi:hypothetical protein